MDFCPSYPRQPATVMRVACFPLDLNKEWEPKGKVCGVCGKPAFGKAYFARAY